MEADEYEREHMELDGPVRYRDRSRQRLVFLRIAAVPALVAAMLVLGVDPSVIAVMGGAGLLGGALDLAMSSFRVVLTGATLHVQHGLRTQRIPVAAIEDVVIAPYRAAEAMLGRGLYTQSRDGSIQRYRAEGQPDTVRVRWRQAGRPRTLILGTAHAGALADALDAARGAGGARVRVELGPEEREALEEVERLLREDALPATRRA